MIRDWLLSVGVSPPLKTDAWTLFVFPDEWGDRFTRRATWLALHTGDGLAEWVRCYSVTPDDVATRTPFGMSLSGKSVLLVGCGSLGSAAAVALAQEGVGNLVLIDGDRFEPGNSVRHQVAVHKFGIPKAVALEERVREVAPHCKVRSVEAHVGLGRSRESREAFSEAFTNADIVVDTTGDQSVGHYLNYLCVTRRKPLVVGWVTNGIWSAEVLRYRPGVSGCRMCWSFGFGDRRPPEQPRARLQFAPGCNQPTFVGGAADVAVAGGLVARMTTETLLDPGAAGYDYLVWVNRTDGGQWQPRVELHAVPRHPQC
ncbi:MAG: ThiF family adenylyltransferase, partial [Synergistales bacterium]|nr:ThiF family adenylyltransferase [Synergistales bacterium]